MNYSRTQFARAYVRLADTYSPQELARGFAALFLRYKGKRNVDTFGEDVVHIWGQQHNTAIATITSARALSQDSRMRIASYLQRAEDKKHVSVTYAINPACIGGVIVRTSTRIYNFSVQGKLMHIL